MKSTEPLSTTTLPAPRRPSAVARRRVVALTILGHPDLGRVGETSILTELAAGREVLLSRGAPLFTAPGAREGRPLGDPCLSQRIPVVLRIEGEGLVIEVPPSLDVRFDGQPAGRLALAPAQLDGGVVIELADRVVVLLHRVYADRSPRTAAHPMLRAIMGESEEIEAVRRDVLQVADLGHPVLIRGRTGTGKELVAEAIAGLSGRRGSFVSVNMGAIAPGVAAAALFGNTANAWNGAAAQSGYFAKADGGTLFMDEVGLTPHDVQSMLLRALDKGEIQPVGETRLRKVDVRLVAATDADLEAWAGAGRFMEPLLHRLARSQIHLPALAERRDDIGRLFVHFLRRALEAQGELDRLEPRGGSEATYLPGRLVAALARYQWPGNVRELQNVAQQIAVSSRGHRHAVVDEKLWQRLERAAPSEPSPAAAPAPARPAREPASYTEEEIVAIAERHRWNVSRMAEDLQMSRTTLYKILERFGLRSPAQPRHEP